MTSKTELHEPPKHEAPKHEIKPEHEAPKHEHEAEAEAKRLADVAKKREEAARKFNEEGLKREEDRLKDEHKADRKAEPEPKFEQSERSKASERDAINLLGTIQASATNADGATTTTAASAFLGGGDVVTAQVTNGAIPPTQACQMILLLSADAVTYYRVDSKWAGFAPSGVYFAKFNMADYADLPDQFGLLLPWLWYKIQFKGNVGQAVTVAATNSGT